LRDRARPAQDRHGGTAPHAVGSPLEGRLIGTEALREHLALAALLSASALGLAFAFPRTDWSGVAWVLVAPVIVVALTRGPGGALGYSQYLRLPVIQIAELGGVHAVSFVLLAVNAAVAGCLVQGWRRALAGVGVAAALVGATLGFGMIRLAEPPAPGQVRVA